MSDAVVCCRDEEVCGLYLHPHCALCLISNEWLLPRMTNSINTLENDEILHCAVQDQTFYTVLACGVSHIMG